MKVRQMSYTNDTRIGLIISISKEHILIDPIRLQKTHFNYSNLVLI